jgi:hypothetical protein
MTCIFEINDADLTLYRNTTVLQRAPAVAVAIGDDVQFGEPALRMSRVHPRQTHQQYFARLSGDPLPGPAGRVRHHADLVYLHLLEWKPLIDAEGGNVLLAVPGILSADQLGVLLGVMQEAGIGVAGFVDSAVAALTRAAGSGRVLHLDVLLQRAVLTELALNDEVRRTAAHEVPECGVGRLLDGWVNVIADRFVRETRFDPLHAAATEQQVFDQVYTWLARDDHADLVIEVFHGGQTHRVELGWATLADKAEQRLRPVADALSGDVPVYLSARSARLPGLERLLRGTGIETSPLPADAVPRGCLDHLALITGGAELRLITRLPRSASRQDPQPAVPEAALTATHALCGHEAVPLAALADQLGLSRAAGGFELRGDADVRLNDLPVTQPARLRAGDRIAAGDDRFILIHVRE